MFNNDFINGIKNSKPFKRGDLLVYLLVLLIVTILFAVFILFPKTQVSAGFKVTVNGELIFTFDNSNGVTVSDGKDGLIETVSTDGGVLVTVYSSLDKSGYNLIFFSTDGTAEIIESDCSLSHDCTFIPKIKDNGAIYCAPRGLKVAPNIGGGFTPPVTG